MLYFFLELEVLLWLVMLLKINKLSCFAILNNSARARQLDRKRVRLACKRSHVRSPRPARSFLETWS